MRVTLSFDVEPGWIEDRQTLAEIAEGLQHGADMGQPYDAVAIVEEYTRFGQPVTVSLERGGERVEFEVGS